MAKKHGRGGADRGIESSGSRTKKALDQARLEGVGREPVVLQKGEASSDLKVLQEKVNEESASVPVTFSFNWLELGNGSMLVPSLLEYGELKEFPEILRELINCTAKGEPFAEDLEAELIRSDPESYGEALIQGLRRWHTYGKERG